MGQTPNTSRDALRTNRQPRTLANAIALLLPAALLTVLAASLPVASVQAADLPDGPGKDVVLKVCTSCHGVVEFTERRSTRMEWDEEVDKMAARGARASDEEFETIVNYLTKYFGKDQPAEKTN